jgi:hypothetical protein
MPYSFPRNILFALFDDEKTEYLHFFAGVPEEKISEIDRDFRTAKMF